MYIFLDGNWVAKDQAKISVLDIAVLRGFGIFDFLRTYGKLPFRLDDHIDRFFNSARLMNMMPNYSKEEIQKIIHEGIEKNGFENTDIKFIQTGGVSADGFTPAEKQSFFVYFSDAHAYPPETYEKGISLITSPLMRQSPQAKTINYAASIVEVMHAKKVGASDILHTDLQGNTYEGTRSNFFAVKDGSIITAQDGILIGITRKVILEILETIQLPTEYRSLNASELDQIDEAFISNSSQEIVPVVKINDITIGDGNVGRITKRLMEEFHKLTTS